MEGQDAPDDADVTEYQRYMHEIECYEGGDTEKWTERGKKIIKRYKDERSARDKNGSRFNILWSNVQTLGPAMYNAPPKPNIERRFDDDDEVGRIASEVLERACSYFLDEENFDSAFKQSVQDRLLPGRGSVWARYVPHFKDASVTGSQEVTNDGTEITDNADEFIPPQEFDYEEVCLDYVHWESFGHNVARIWQDVYLVWRQAYLTRQELIDRFGEEIGGAVSLDYEPRKLDGSKMKEAVNKATIYEMWDKSKGKAVWLSKHYEHGLLDSREDPLKLKNFFPCPKPIYATLTNDSLIPIPDYLEYQDQAMELDELTARISSLTKAVKVAGVYDASAQGVQRLLAEGVENQLIPVDQWALFAEKGGIKGVVDFMPIKDIVDTLLALYEARERVKKDLYEITGIADIIRGQSNPNETLGAQQIKSQFATLRLDTAQKDVARLTRDVVRITAEIIAEHFSMDTIKNISGVKLLTNMEKQQLKLQMQAPQPGMPPPPPVDPKMAKLLNEPSWEDIEQLIRNEQIRCYRIDIETDSTIKQDQEADRTAANEFIAAAGSFIQQAAQVQDPTLRPLLMSMLMLGVRNNKMGDTLEPEFEAAMDSLRKQAENPPPPQQPQDNSLQVKQLDIQAQAQKQQADSQTQLAKAQLQAQNDEKERQLKLALAQADMQQRDKEMAHEKQLQDEKIAADLLSKEQDRQHTALMKSLEPPKDEKPMAERNVIRYDKMGNRS